jgi:phycoerythrin-associated linker protein
MEIAEFLELCAGKWFSLRTSYHLDRAEVENSKSDLTVERLSQDSPEIIALCQQSNIDASASLGGTKTLWDNSPDWGKPKQTGSAILILIGDRDRPQTGKLVHAAGMPAKTPISGRYVLGNDEALTFIVEEEKLYLEERLWYASPNLRLRTSSIKHANGFSRTAFYSEIRKVAPKQ